MRSIAKIAFGLIGWAASLSAVAAEGNLQDASEPAADVSIKIAENPDGSWDVTYKFAEPQSALVLSQAPVPYPE